MLKYIDSPKGFQRLISSMLAVLLAAVMIVSLTAAPTIEIDDWDTPLATGNSVDISGTMDYGAGQEVLQYVNKLRKSLGLNELVMDKDLTNAAMQRAAEISVSFSHTRPDGSKCFTVSKKSYGENIAAGYNSARSVYDGWENSPGHYANMVRDGYKSIGIACYKVDGAMYWVQLFGYASAAKDTRSSSASGTLTVALSKSASSSEKTSSSSSSYSAPELSSAKADGSMGMKLTWVPTSGVTTYQISYQDPTSDEWTTMKFSNIKKSKMTTILSDLTAAGKYSVKIRGVYDANGSTCYTEWSETKTVKVKK